METQERADSVKSVENLLDTTISSASYKIGKNQYSEIELNEEEISEALRLMRKEKYHKLKEKEWRESMYKQHLPVKMNREQFIEYLKETEPQLNQDFQRNQFDFMIDYFTSEQQKGLLLFGGVGCGKTTLMEAFQWNPISSYAVKSCREISELFAKKDGGYDAIRPFKSIMTGQRNDFNQTEYGICFDDLGEEKSKRHFGNEANVMEELILSRYERRELWNKTHITTNLTVNQIEEIYGARVRSRMREMFVAVEFTGIGDLRK